MWGGMEAGEGAAGGIWVRGWRGGDGGAAGWLEWDWGITGERAVKLGGQAASCARSLVAEGSLCLTRWERRATSTSSARRSTGHRESAAAPTSASEAVQPCMWMGDGQNKTTNADYIHPTPTRVRDKVISERTWSARDYGSGCAATIE
ncbi:hypothetical protein CC85DRAFT_47612 [Cutaneotrichosporon oleaginosum]|uniref:Uncharacterized protein n=1 Tax=Cutaneotrichosporon oleaginosum TaxID=879819 RepID=A0A0J1B6Y9_9TREE|nr:uncharacterized protein CC85DRAFT_47612 [Cutaneotrichosporon oleaginosum]KLT43484.1 hypothetical protein CC85DRAFT_47612 [Cutaneotrichosporon oleaginosum]TXT05613.1 hypothetical protein COLE_06933 [Cutaneotrichosporon oleaginosum]